MTASLVEHFNLKNHLYRFEHLPHRIYLDTNVIQYMNNFGEFIYDNYIESDDYLISRSGKIIKIGSFLYDQILAIRELLHGLDRTNFEFAVSKSVYDEVIKTNKMDDLNWFMEWYHFWQNILESYGENNINPYNGSGIKLANKARCDIKIDNWLSKEDQLILFDALELECNAILTCDKYRNMQDEIYNEYNIMTLYPTDYLEIIADFQALWY